MFEKAVSGCMSVCASRVGCVSEYWSKLHGCMSSTKLQVSVCVSASCVVCEYELASKFRVCKRPH